MANEAVEGLAAWMSLSVATLSGVIIGVGTCIRWMWRLSDRVLTLESKVGEHSVMESLRLDRHDNVYPMIQDRIILPLDTLEREVRLLERGQATLLERDRIAALFMSTKEKPNG